MKFEKILLTEEAHGPCLDAYIADPMKGFTRKAMLVLPGGGYGKITELECEPIAHAFLPYGYQSFVLRYTVGRESGKTFPTQLIEVARAIKHIKDHATEYGIDPEELFVVGFSAGGHLCASAGILWKLPEIYEAVDMPWGYNKPRGIIPIYPVISAEGGHFGSFQNLWCSDAPTKEQLERVSLEKHVDRDSAPAFIVHSPHDKTVPVQNSLLLAAAYSRVGVSYEMHIFPNVPHASGLGNEITAHGHPERILPAYAEWVRMAAAWANTL
ncbi:MAG: alpha/beta hydrolase [Clostridia bacterium]|nr:alpha/beta hydrolase [Clostridia bacterium]